MDIAELGLKIVSDDVPRATTRLKDFRKEAGLAEAAAGSLKRLATMGLAAVAAGFAAFGVGIGAAVKRMEEMRKLSAQVDQALKNSGNSARTSASEIEAWADKLEARTGRAAEEIMSVSANLASFGFSRQAFFRSLELADDMSAAWGGDLKQNLEGLARALAEPEKGLAMLTKRGITFTDEQKKMIAAFVQTNDLAGAQGVVFDALEAQVKGVAEAGFTGLTKSLHTMQKAWDDAFEKMVEGDGTAKSLTETIQDLAATMSSPEFIAAAIGMGNAIVDALQFAINAIITVSGYIKDLQSNMNWMASHDMFGNQIKGQKPGGNEFIKWNTPDEAKQLLTDQLNKGDTAGPDASFYNGILPQPEPGSMLGRASYNPYEGVTLGGADKDKAAAKAKKAYDELILSANQFIGEQQLEAQALGMTQEAASRLRHEQDMLNQAANDNLTLTPKQTQAIGDLATQMAAAEEQTRRLTEIYDTGKAIFSSFFGDLKSGIEDGNSLWESLGKAASNALDSIANKALEMAANGIWDMIFGSLFGGASTGGGGIGSLLGGLFGGGRANGGPVEAGMIYRVNENTPNSEFFMPRTSGTIIPKLPAANQNQSNDNAAPVINIYNQNGSTVKTKEKQGPNGRREMEIFILETVGEAARRGRPGFSGFGS